MASIQPATSAAAGAEPRSDRVLKLVRVFDAPREAVYRAWTDPQRIVQWWGPEGMHVPEYSFDSRVGGAWRTVMRSKDGTDHICSGVYQEMTPPERLVMTWAWEEDGVRGHETTLTIELRAQEADKTELTLTQEVFASRSSRDGHEGGWTSSFVCLAQYLEQE